MLRIIGMKRIFYAMAEIIKKPRIGAMRIVD